METATISEIKKALLTLSPRELSEICLRLCKYRKENKELVSYLIFEADDNALFLKHVKQQMDHEFKAIHQSNIYLAKKTIRKVLSTTNKYIKFAGSKQTEVELLIYYLTCLKDTGLPFEKYPVTHNIYLRQMEKIQKALQSLHEDLQYDYQQIIEQKLL